MPFDYELFRALKAGLRTLTDSERNVLQLIWKHPNVPVYELPTRVGKKASGLVWLTIGGRIAKEKLWHRMPARVRRANHSPGYRPFYSGLLVKLSFVEDRDRQTMAVFELHEEVRALRELGVIGSKRYPPSLKYKRLDEIDVREVPSGFSRAAERSRINRSIAARLGQPRFRSELMSVYEGKCAVTGCNQQSALEAAHIIGFRKKGRYEASNGLLLRADWHTLFDLGLWTINPKGFRVELSANITDKEYRKFHGRRIRIPVDTRYAPDLDAIRGRYKRFKQISRRRLA